MSSINLVCLNRLVSVKCKCRHSIYFFFFFTGVEACRAISYEIALKVLEEITKEKYNAYFYFTLCVRIITASIISLENRLRVISYTKKSSNLRGI